MSGLQLTLRLLVAMLQDDVCGVVHSDGQVLDGAFAKLVHSEDVVVHVCDAVDVVLEDVNAEGVTQLWVKSRVKVSGQADSVKTNSYSCRRCQGITQLFLMLSTATTGSLPLSLTLQINESFASAQYRRSLK